MPLLSPTQTRIADSIYNYFDGITEDQYKQFLKSAPAEKDQMTVSMEEENLLDQEKALFLDILRALTFKSKFFKDYRDAALQGYEPPSLFKELVAPVYLRLVRLQNYTSVENIIKLMQYFGEYFDIHDEDKLILESIETIPAEPKASSEFIDRHSIQLRKMLTEILQLFSQFGQTVATKTAELITQENNLFATAEEQELRHNTFISITDTDKLLDHIYSLKERRSELLYHNILYSDGTHFFYNLDKIELQAEQGTLLWQIPPQNKLSSYFTLQHVSCRKNQHGVFILDPIKNSATDQEKKIDIRFVRTSLDHPANDVSLLDETYKNTAGTILIHALRAKDLSCTVQILNFEAARTKNSHLKKDAVFSGVSESATEFFNALGQALSTFGLTALQPAEAHYEHKIYPFMVYSNLENVLGNTLSHNSKVYLESSTFKVPPAFLNNLSGTKVPEMFTLRKDGVDISPQILVAPNDHAADLLSDAEKLKHCFDWAEYHKGEIKLKLQYQQMLNEAEEYVRGIIAVFLLGEFSDSVNDSALVATIDRDTFQAAAQQILDTIKKSEVNASAISLPQAQTIVKNCLKEMLIKPEPQTSCIRSDLEYLVEKLSLCFTVLRNYFPEKWPEIDRANKSFAQNHQLFTLLRQHLTALYQFYVGISQREPNREAWAREVLTAVLQDVDKPNYYILGLSHNDIEKLYNLSIKPTLQAQLLQNQVRTSCYTPKLDKRMSVTHTRIKDLLNAFNQAEKNNVSIQMRQALTDLSTDLENLLDVQLCTTAIDYDKLDASIQTRIENFYKAYLAQLLSPKKAHLPDADLFHIIHTHITKYIEYTPKTLISYDLLNDASDVAIVQAFINELAIATDTKNGAQVFWQAKSRVKTELPPGIRTISNAISAVENLPQNLAELQKLMDSLNINEKVRTDTSLTAYFSTATELTAYFSQEALEIYCFIEEANQHIKALSAENNVANRQALINTIMALRGFNQSNILSRDIEALELPRKDSALYKNIFKKVIAAYKPMEDFTYTGHSETVKERKNQALAVIYKEIPVLTRDKARILLMYMLLQWRREKAKSIAKNREGSINELINRIELDLLSLDGKVGSRLLGDYSMPLTYTDAEGNVTEKTLAEPVVAMLDLIEETFFEKKIEINDLISAEEVKFVQRTNVSLAEKEKLIEGLKEAGKAEASRRFTFFSSNEARDVYEKIAELELPKMHGIEIKPSNQP